MTPASLDRIFQALADPTRRAIVERLSRGPCSVSELARPHDMALPSVMQHLQRLEDAGLVRSHKAGRIRTCRIEPGALQKVERWAADRRTLWERRFDRLGELLDGPEPRRARRLRRHQLTVRPGHSPARDR